MLLFCCCFVVVIVVAAPVAVKVVMLDFVTNFLNCADTKPKSIYSTIQLRKPVSQDLNPGPQQQQVSVYAAMPKPTSHVDKSSKEGVYAVYPGPDFFGGGRKNSGADRKNSSSTETRSSRSRTGSNSNSSRTRSSSGGVQPGFGAALPPATLQSSVRSTKPQGRLPTASSSPPKMQAETKIYAKYTKPGATSSLGP